jgi:hypothetical protein
VAAIESGQRAAGGLPGLHGGARHEPLVGVTHGETRVLDRGWVLSRFDPLAEIDAHAPRRGDAAVLAEADRQLRLSGVPTRVEHDLEEIAAGEVELEAIGRREVCGEGQCRVAACDSQLTGERHGADVARAVTRQSLAEADRLARVVLATE